MSKPHGYKPASPIARTPKTITRFEKYVRRGDGCWQWIGRRRHDGYGVFWNREAGQAVAAHRIAWMLYVGEFDLRLNVCHSCDNRLCVNPAHLWIGTDQDNTADMVAKKRSKPFRRLDRQSVAEIRVLRGIGASYSALANAYGVSAPNIVAIVKQRTWKDVGP